jgi:hypothetical protein
MSSASGLRERWAFRNGGDGVDGDDGQASRRMSVFSGGPEDAGFEDRDPGFERRQRRGSISAFKESGFSTFTSGIGLGWAAESKTLRFRQVR